jgi:hypothetical protein
MTNVELWLVNVVALTCLCSMALYYFHLIF